jgi:hypothetical protein
MPDLAEQLRELVDGATDPLTAEAAKRHAAFRRRRSRAALVGLLAAGVVVAAGVAIAAGRRTGPSSTRTADRARVPTAVADPGVGYDAIVGRATGAPIPFTAIRTGRDRRHVVVAFQDPRPGEGPLDLAPAGATQGQSTTSAPPACTRGYTVTARRGGTSTELSIRAVLDPSPPIGAARVRECLPTGVTTTLRATLPRPLSGPTVRDGASGQVLPVFDGSRLLEPTVLPASTHLDLVWSEAGGWASAYTDGATGPPGILISLYQGYTSPIGRAAPMQPVRVVRVGGHDAELLASGAIRALHWTHDSTEVLVLQQPVAPTGPDDALDPVLFAFAEGLR